METSRIIWQGPRLTLYGDQALIDLGARRAAQLDQLVGPYSREGFHHPGPALFYVLAPFVRMPGFGDAGLFVGAMAINVVALVASVVVVTRRLGRGPGLWTAVCITVLYCCIGIGTLREPWNPYLVVAPTLLFIVLWTFALTDPSSRGLLPWALVVASFTVQTDVGTLPVLGVLSAALVVVRVRAHRRSARLASWTAGEAAGWAALLLMWTPPVVELVRDRPNNLSLFWAYVTHHPDSAPAGSALRAGLTSLGVVPFGNHDYVTVLHRSGLELAAIGLLIPALAFAAIRASTATTAREVRALVGASIMVATVGTLSLVAAPEPLYPYLSEWMAVVPVILIVALGAALRDRLARPHLVEACLVGLAIAGGTLAVASDLRTVPIQSTAGSGPWPASLAYSSFGKMSTVSETALFDKKALSALPPGTGRVRVVIASSGLWPFAAGMVLALSRSGVNAAVEPRSWDLYFGTDRAPPHAPVLTLEPRSGPVGGPGKVIAVTPVAVLLYQPGSSS